MRAAASPSSASEGPRSGGFRRLDPTFGALQLSDPCVKIYQEVLGHLQLAYKRRAVPPKSVPAEVLEYAVQGYHSTSRDLAVFLPILLRSVLDLFSRCNQRAI